MKNTIFPIFLVFLIIGLMSCQPSETPQPEPEPGGGETVSRGSDESPYAAAENLAKRLILYKTALQENELASLTAMPESVSGLNDPDLDLALMLNATWWSIDWEGAHLNPLSPAEITSLEQDVFPLINAAIEKKDDEAGWVMFVLSFDSDLLKEIIARAHEEWMPEQQTVYKGTSSENCMQVWCVKVQGEWKILAHFDCQPDVEVPEIPAPPSDLFSPDEPSDIETVESEQLGTEGEE